MTIILLLIPAALLLALFGLGAFFWTVRSGQYEDMDGAAQRILLDDDGPLPERADGDQDGKRSR
ncbi:MULTISPECIES: cbb3-type cytochrome oxidase assembly protein CcoS [Hyphobacterium]|uniref:Cbb3-type cytochrome oxidase assembly protein CcoS n=1 Tax=Hyphobacterium vulgare TaxID=1736751 RepID=A0ABV7A1C8_9PROT